MLPVPLPDTLRARFTAFSDEELVLIITASVQDTATPSHFYLDNIHLRQGWTYTTSCDPANLLANGGEDGYRYTFNGQEQENELNPSITSAEFWMYEGRLGRRWNVDPEYQKFPHISGYSTNNNNPLLYEDMNGDQGKISIYARTSDGGLELVSAYKVAGHVTKDVWKYKTDFKGTFFETTSLVRYAGAFDYTQTVIIDPFSDKFIQVGEKKSTGKAKATSGFGGYFADAAARRLDKDKGLLGTFNIREASGFEEWLESNIDQEELAHLFKTFGSIYAASPDAPEDKNITLTKARAKSIMFFKQVANKIEYGIKCPRCSSYDPVHIDKWNGEGTFDRLVKEKLKK
jgi:hypothetical protein